MGLQYKVPDYKKIRVIIDTDAACEADDPFAIAHALLCEKFEIKAIFAEQFGSPDTTAKSYEEILTILDCMDMEVPVYMGEEGSLADVAGKELSPAGKFLIEEALRDEERPLYVLCLGAITNVVAAIKQCPDIIPRMTVIWIGGQDPENVRSDFREFNSGNDIEAANYIVSSGVKLWMIPSSVYGSMQIGLAEIQRRIYPCGRIGKHLFENMIAYNFSKNAGWTAGESWSLGDSPAVGVALDPNCGKYMEMEAPIFAPDTTYRYVDECCSANEDGCAGQRPRIRIYTSVNVRFILEDMIAKLELVYGE